MKKRGRKNGTQNTRDALIIILAGLVGVFLSKFIDIVWKSPNIWSPLVLISAIIVTFFIAFAAVKLLPK